MTTIKTLCDAFEPANATVTADSAAARWHDLEVEKTEFKPGDILRIKDHRNWPGEKWANARFKVIKKVNECGAGRQPIYRLERLDLPSHARQNWGHGWFEKVDQL